MPTRNFNAQLKFVIPMPILLTGLLLPFTMGYFDANFLIGFCLATLIFVTTVVLQIDAPEEDEVPPKEQPDECPMENQGLSFYLRGNNIVEVRTQDGRSYRWITTIVPPTVDGRSFDWITGKNGLNYMAKGMNCGIYHGVDGRAYISFWHSDGDYYTKPVNPWATSPDIGDINDPNTPWVKDFQVSN